MLLLATVSKSALQPINDLLRELLRMKQPQVRREPAKLFVLKMTGFSNRQDVPHIERRENLRLASIAMLKNRLSFGSTCRTNRSGGGGISRAKERYSARNDGKFLSSNGSVA